MYDWNDIVSNIDEDISEYLVKRYEDYWKDRNEKSGYIYAGEIGKRHDAVQQQLIRLGLELRDKLSFFLPESRKELFEQMIKKYKILDICINKMYNDYCKKLDEITNALPFHKRRESYKLHFEKSNKKKELFKLKEDYKDEGFIKLIDDRKANYLKKKAEEEARRIAEEKKEALRIRRKGYTNIKPLSFYEEMYLADEDVDEYNESILFMEEQQEEDRVFQETGIYEDEVLLPKIYEICSLIDTPEENQKYLNRCKEIRKLLDDLSLFDEEVDWIRVIIDDADILQKYLTEGYLITRQIFSFVYRLNHWTKYLIIRLPNQSFHHFNKHPAMKYDIDIYSDNFDIEQVNEDISELYAKTKKYISTPIKELNKYLKEHNNEITIVDYARFKIITPKVAKRILKGFEEKGELKSKKVGKSHKLVFYV